MKTKSEIERNISFLEKDEKNILIYKKALMNALNQNLTDNDMAIIVYENGFIECCESNLIACEYVFYIGYEEYKYEDNKIKITIYNEDKNEDNESYVEDEIIFDLEDFNFYDVEDEIIFDLEDFNFYDLDGNKIYSKKKRHI